MNYKDVLEVGDFNGRPVLTVPVGYNINFTFGFQKAVCLTNHEAELKEFVRTNGNGAGNPKIVISQYKGHPIIEIPTDKKKYPIRLGLSKARAVAQYMPEICEFVLDCEETAYYGAQGAPTENAEAEAGADG